MNFFIVWTFSMPKFAIIALLRRILRLSKPVEYTFWGIATVNQAGILATAILWFARCQPAAKAWDPTLPGTCGTLEVLGDLGYVTSALSAALDIFFALYPIPFIMKLNMSLRRRISTSISLGLGSIACVVSIYKITTFPSSIVELSVDPTCKSTQILDIAVLLCTDSFPQLPWFRSYYLLISRQISLSCPLHSQPLVLFSAGSLAILLLPSIARTAARVRTPVVDLGATGICTSSTMLRVKIRRHRETTGSRLSNRKETRK